MTMRGNAPKPREVEEFWMKRHSGRTAFVLAELTAAIDDGKSAAYVNATNCGIGGARVKLERFKSPKYNAIAFGLSYDLGALRGRAFDVVAIDDAEYIPDTVISQISGFATERLIIIRTLEEKREWKSETMSTAISHDDTWGALTGALLVLAIFAVFGALSYLHESLAQHVAK